MIYKQLQEWHLDEGNWPIDRREIKTQYSLGHQNGPKSGIVEYEGKQYLAWCFEEIGSTRRFWVIDIGQERINQLIEYCNKRIEAFGNYILWKPEGEHFIHRHGTLGEHESRETTDAWNKANPHVDWHPAENDEVIGYFVGWSLY